MFSDFFGGRMQAKRIEIENSCPIDIGRSVAGAFVADFIARQEGSKSALIVTDREVAGLYLKEITEAFWVKFSPNIYHRRKSFLKNAGRIEACF